MLAVGKTDIIHALAIPPMARMDVRVPKKLLVENGAPTAADKRQLNDGIEELLWVAALKPSTIGVPSYRDEIREYLEIAVLSLTLRPDAKAQRLTDLIHRAIPYPVLLIQTQQTDVALSLAHLRWSQGQVGQTVLDASPIVAMLDAEASPTNDFLASLNVASQPRQNLQAFYNGWVARFEAYAAARLTGRFIPAPDASSSERRHAALEEHERLTRQIAGLRSRAAKETQLNHRVDLNLQVKQLEPRLAETVKQL